MTRRLLRLLMALMALATVPLWVQGCSSTTSSSPAAAPAPPVELPTPAVLKFVSFDALNIDFSTIGGSKAEAIKANPPIGTDILEKIQGGPLVYSWVASTFFAPALNGIQEIDIPTVQDGQPTVNYAATVTFSATTGLFSGTHAVAFDFTAFDFDNSGTKATCSGNAAEVPICVRFWMDDIPQLAGIFDAVPVYAAGATTPTEIGKGRFKLRVTNLQGFDHLFSYSYDQGTTGTPLKTVEFLWHAGQNPQAQIPPPSGLVQIDLRYLRQMNAHVLLSQSGPDTRVLKSLNWATLIDYQDPTTTMTSLGGYLAQYLEGGDRWSGSWASDGVRNGTPTVFVEPANDVCATLPDGIVVDVVDCQARGIDVGSTPFVSQLQASDVAFPTDFPAAPTF